MLLSACGTSEESDRANSARNGRAQQMLNRQAEAARLVCRAPRGMGQRMWGMCGGACHGARQAKARNGETQRRRSSESARERQPRDGAAQRRGGGEERDRERERDRRCGGDDLRQRDGGTRRGGAVSRSEASARRECGRGKHKARRGGACSRASTSASQVQHQMGSLQAAPLPSSVHAAAGLCVLRCCCVSDPQALEAASQQPRRPTQLQGSGNAARAAEDQCQCAPAFRARRPSVARPAASRASGASAAALRSGRKWAEKAPTARAEGQMLRCAAPGAAPAAARRAECCCCISTHIQQAGCERCPGGPSASASSRRAA
jgi:hypothetical protein